jgi:hypothetical protein
MLLVMGQLAFPFILLPAGMMAGLWHALRASRAKMLVRFFAVASVGYIAAVMAATAWLQAFLMDKLPAGAPPFFVEMYVIAGALTPWAVFALRDRRNQLFIIMLWAMLAGCLLMLPLRLSGAAGGLGYALGIWAVMLAVLFVENLRETRRAARIAQAEERAKAAEEAPPSDDKAPEA